MGRKITTYITDELDEKIKKYRLQYSEVLKLGMHVYEAIGKISKLDEEIEKLSNMIEKLNNVIEKMNELLDANKKMYTMMYNIMLQIASRYINSSSDKKVVYGDRKVYND